MKINELLSETGIELGAVVGSKDEAIDKLIGLLDAEGCLSDKAAFKEGILKRESHSSTGIGGGIAIPHAKVDAVKKAGLAAMTVPAGVDYQAMDKKPSDLFFMIAAPASGSDIHLQALQRLAVILMDPAFKKSLLEAKDKNAFLALIAKKEAEKYPEKPAAPAQTEKTAEAKSETKPAAKYRVLAVTACPTGIAHTFMAAENLELKGKQMGIPVKAETNGADGVKNPLTTEEITAADGIIVAADKNVDMARFDGKPVVITSVSAGINKAEELIRQVVDGKAPIYHHAGGKGSARAEEASGESAGHRIYKHLMNGVSHMLPFVVGGGILIALAFLIDSLSGVHGGPNFGSTTPVAAFFKGIGGFSFNMMLPVLAGFIAMSIADRPGLAVGFVGGLVAQYGATFANPQGTTAAADIVAKTHTVSAGFLGALLAGFVAGYLVLLLKKLFSYLPKALEGIKPVLLYPLVGILVIGIIMAAIDPLMGLINIGIGDFLNFLNSTHLSALVGIIVGGMMAIDMGGPINKAAYLFSTGLLTNAAQAGVSASSAAVSYRIMASCMAGGMVPPLAIALCTTLFKNRFTPKERQSGLVNYVLGLSFITEGAIPYAAGDPIHVIPSLMVGSAVGGGLSMIFGCQLRAPHGGIFVLPTISNPLGYFIALAAGMIVGAIVLSILKKPLPKEVYDAEPVAGDSDLF
ncbi:PTS fructose transporter subunit IIABC [Ethanoligenens harbinense]|uniref:PTS system, fructose subfamily, IIC subunit n=1 Tax=Ethanoligenens harbinense (strain DSM 18485 / JCM 12961 / CGMCC 1.5033 / YUAN-3) TaxID=663278 RepID=E6U347_ETHHY|nr:fructose-specific PTS transporter subunit EIIC [Ethanoligenens harbinense]ADU27519.1 PTS system, fructose subfamily, IIC subunit [Ethanoligenens harbinense YUAN-3]AVQ96571.1 PTS fructose transporter subunit IIC [Ethanoligenens harbinense YUAN-3]AYF39232.1 PTS fructose transporter subunit IIC [Ethanoligenens harbinense]AYF42056.1 PTS fructose transporter subunit IIC [Ethanoligenens harbinense]QCN92811.1 PTS fructose transporter subunit IIC [Ethanoligenens harbinense]